MDTPTRVFTIIYGGTSVIAFVLNLGVVVSNVRVMNRLPASPLICVCLCVIDVINSFTNSTFALLRLTSNDDFMGGDVACSIEGSLLLFGSAMTLLLCLSLTLFRYFSIVKRRQVSRKMALRSIAGCIIMAAVLPFLVYLDGKSYSFFLEPSGVYCLIKWTSRDLKTLVFVGITLLCISTPVAIIIWAYISIYILFKTSVKNIKDVFSSGIPRESEGTQEHEGVNSMDQKSTPNSGRANSFVLRTNLSDRKESLPLSLTSPMNQKLNRFNLLSGDADAEQRNLLLQSICIASSFLLGWTPYLIMLICELSLDILAVPWIDFICVYSIILNQVCNPLIIYHFNQHIRTNIIHLIFERHVAQND